MPAFEYTAEDETGLRQRGVVEASSEDEARDQLTRRGWTVQELGPVASPIFDESPPARRPTPPSALSLLTNLRALSEDLPTVRIRGAVGELADRVERGDSLAAAFAAVKDRLPTSMQTLMGIGLSRGRLDLLLAAYLDQTRRRADIRTTAWLSLSYPALLFMVVVALAIGVSVFVIPVFENIFEDFDIELPGMTQLVVHLSRFLREAGPWLLLIGGLAVVATWFALRIGGGPGLPQRLFRQIPWLGSVFRWSSLASSAETLAMLVEIETPLPQALRTAADLSDDLALAKRLRIAADELDQGVPVAGLRWRLPRELLGSFRWADRPLLLSDALRSTGEVFAARARVDLHLTRWVLEPVVLLCVAVGIGVVFVSLFMPLIKLLNDLS